MDPTVSLVVPEDVLEVDLDPVPDPLLVEDLALLADLLLAADQDPMRASVIMVETDSMVVTLADLLLLLELSLPTDHLLLADHLFQVDLDPDDPDSMGQLADQAQEADLDLEADPVPEADPDPLVDPDPGDVLDPLVSVVVAVDQDSAVDPLLVQVLLPLLLLDLVKILAEVAETVASRAPNPASVVPAPMALPQSTGRTPNDRPCSTNSKVRIGTNSVRVDSGTSTTPSARRFANVRVSLGIPQIVTNSTSATGTNGWKNTPSMCSLAPSF